jgi:hypothetical protein
LARRLADPLERLQRAEAYLDRERASRLLDTRAGPQTEFPEAKER